MSCVCSPARWGHRMIGAAGDWSRPFPSRAQNPASGEERIGDMALVAVQHEPVDFADELAIRALDFSAQYLGR